MIRPAAAYSEPSSTSCVGHVGVSYPRLRDCLDSNYKIKKAKCFIWFRFGTVNPFFLSLGCTELPEHTVVSFPAYFCRLYL